MVSQRFSVASLLLLATVTAVAGTPIDERQAAAADGEVEVSNVAGEVSITGWDRSEIEVTGVLGEGSERLDFIRDGRRTLIKVVLPKRGNSRGSSLIIKVPQDSNVVVNVVSADIDVSAVRGAHDLSAVSGDVEVNLGSGNAEAGTVSGDVEVTGSGVLGRVAVNTVSGDLDLSNIAGELVASTVSGDITVEKSRLARLKANTTNGDIDIRSEIAPNGRVNLETTNGDVDLVINGKDDVNVSIDTFNGDIDNCFGVEVETARGFGPGNELRFSSGDEQRRLRVRTLNGDVDVCAYQS